MDKTATTEISLEDLNSVAGGVMPGPDGGCIPNPFPRPRPNPTPIGPGPITDPAGPSLPNVKL